MVILLTLPLAGLTICTCCPQRGEFIEVPYRLLPDWIQETSCYIILALGRDLFTDGTDKILILVDDSAITRGSVLGKECGTVDVDMSYENFGRRGQYLTIHPL